MDIENRYRIDSSVQQGVGEQSIVSIITWLMVDVKEQPIVNT